MIHQYIFRLCIVIFCNKHQNHVEKFDEKSKDQEILFHELFSFASNGHILNNTKKSETVQLLPFSQLNSNAEQK